VDKDDGGDPGALRVDDPWKDSGTAGLWVPDRRAPVPEEVRSERQEGYDGHDGHGEDEGPGGGDGRAAVYLEVQRGAAFGDVRDRYRRFVFPAAAAFFGWYLLYVVAATTAPRLMAHRLAGELNVAMVAGLAQFATTFLLTWAYARHARLHRDRAALDLRWSLATRTGQERLR
jgi:uncharacterized membrane protein (DUF485 family)